ncbi:MAG: AAA family ATPase [Planctomycetia bacterium]|nr:AAA family ATPase [Planctomycetia bacterium]
MFSVLESIINTTLGAAEKAINYTFNLGAADKIITEGIVFNKKEGNKAIMDLIDVSNDIIKERINELGTKNSLREDHMKLYDRYIYKLKKLRKKKNVKASEIQGIVDSYSNSIPKSTSLVTESTKKRFLRESSEIIFGNHKYRGVVWVTLVTTFYDNADVYTGLAQAPDKVDVKIAGGTTIVTTSRQLSIDNLERIEIVELMHNFINDERNRAITSYKHSVMTGFRINETSSSKLSVLMRSWKGLDSELINESNKINTYLGLNASITPELNKLYANYNYKDCFPTFLHLYLRRKRSNKQVITSGELESFLKYDSYDLQFLPIELRGGVTLRVIHNYCYSKNISYCAIDSLDSIVGYHTCLFKDTVLNPIYSPFKTLYFAVCNNHIYPIDDKGKKRSLSSKLKNKFWSGKDKGNKNDIVYSREILTAQFDEFIHNGIMPLNRFEGGECVSITVDKTQYVKVDYDIKKINIICKKLGFDKVKYRFQLMSAIRGKMNVKKSLFNPEVKEVFLANMKGGKHFFTERLQEGDLSIDLGKAYSSILLNTTIKWPVFGPQDYIQDYKGERIEPSILYFVEPVQDIANYLFSGNNFYIGKLVSLGLRYKLIEKVHIHRFIKPSLIETNTYLAKLFKNKKLSKSESKSTLNTLSGTFNMKNRTKRITTVICGVNNLKAFIEKHGVGNVEIQKYKGSPNIYICSKIQKIEVHYFDIPLYYHILDLCMIKVFKEIVKIRKRYKNASILGIKTDAIKLRIYDKSDLKRFVLSYPKKNNKSKMGGWYREDIILGGIKTLGVCNYGNNIPEITTDTWNDVMKKNAIILGRAGTGKTYTLLNRFKKMDNWKYAPTVAYTNSAAVNVGGVTLNRYFSNIRKNNTASDDIMSESYQKKNKLIIDEIFCTSIEQLEEIYLLALSGVRMISAGDSKQLMMTFIYKASDKSAIEKYTISLIELIFPKCILLKKMYRYDKALEKITDPDNPNIMAVNTIDISKCITKDHRHICYYNKSVDHINGLYPDFDPDTPYIAIINNKKLNFVKNELFTYKQIKLRKLSLSQFKKAYAITVYRAQGKTIHQTVVLWDIDRLKQGNREMYTAMTRATSFGKLKRAFNKSTGKNFTSW